MVKYIDQNKMSSGMFKTKNAVDNIMFLGRGEIGVSLKNRKGNTLRFTFKRKRRYYTKTVLFKGMFEYIFSPKTSSKPFFPNTFASRILSS